MTISNPTNIVTYTGNGVTTIFPFTFLIPEGTAVLTLTTIATGVESAEINSSLYTITGEDNPSGGSITYPLTGSPVSSDYYVNIKRVVDIAQSLDLTSQSSYLPDLLESQLDLIVMMIAQLDEMVGRAILIGPGGAADGLVAAILAVVDDTLANATAAAASETAAAASAVAAATAAATFTAASTTEILTGTNTTKFASADAIAALWEKGADIASAGTISIGEGGLFHITGTTSITDIDFATPKDGRRATLIFDGILTLTYNATTLKMPGNASIITAAGDRCVVVQENSDNVLVESYTRADGTAITATSSTAASQADMEAGASTTTYVPPARIKYAPGQCKCWGYVTISGGVPSISASQNLSSITDSGVGQFGVVINVDHSSSNYCILLGVDSNSTTLIRAITYDTLSGGTFNLKIVEEAASTVDASAFSFGTWGDQ